VSNINVWEHETNVENALFQVIVTKEVYMDQLPSYFDPRHPYIYFFKLKKFLYGLKQLCQRGFCTSISVSLHLASLLYPLMFPSSCSLRLQLLCVLGLAKEFN
jgi:hypothetical protein